MKISKYLSISLVISLGLVLIPWILTFYDSFSVLPKDWAYFGSYFGGVFSSLVAALALIALIYTIYQQNKQIQILNSKETKADILKTLYKLEQDFEKAIEGKFVTINENGGSTYTPSLRDALFNFSFIEYKEVIKTQEEIIEFSKSKSDNEIRKIMIIFESLGFAAAELNQMKLYINALKKIERESKKNILARYYIRKYELAASRLYEQGILKEQWNFEND